MNTRNDEKVTCFLQKTGAVPKPQNAESPLLQHDVTRVIGFI